MKIKLAAISLLCCIACVAHAQMGSTTTTTTSTQPDASKPFDAIWSTIEKQVVSAAEAMPAEKYSFAPTQAIFKDSQKTDFATPTPVRAFGGEVAHVAQANYYFFSSFAAEKPDADMAAMDKLTSKADIVAALKKSFAYGHRAIATITVQNAFVGVGPKQAATPAGMTDFASMHCMDHYGQMVVYLRMNGIVPPASVPQK